MPRILRNLQIREISGVDKGAGRGVKILLMKRFFPDDNIDIASIPAPAAEKQESITMRAENITRKAMDVWDEHLALLQKSNNCSRSRAFDLAMQQSASARELFGLLKSASAFDVLKLGGGGRVPSPTHARGHGDSSNAATVDPHNSVRSTETGEDALARLRNEHPGKPAEKYASIVRAKVAAGMSQSEAHDCARRECPDGWQAMKSLSVGDVHVTTSIGNPGRSMLNAPNADAARYASHA
jgi:hypothetical protein